MIIAMTGATSFLGINLLREISKDNLVYCFVRRDSPKKKFLNNILNAIIIECNLEELQSYVPNFCVDIFIHFAWAGSGVNGRLDFETQDKNYLYSINAIELAYKLKARLFVFSGSQAEYGIKHSLILENDACNPKSYYAIVKNKFARDAETILENRNMNFLHLRIFSVYGYGDHNTSLINICIDSFINNKQIVLGPCSQLWNYINIHDFSLITYKVIKYAFCMNTGFKINIASHDTRILRNFVQDIYEECNYGGSYEFGKLNPNPEGLSDLNPSTSLMDKIIGDYKFVDFRSGISEMIEEIKNENKVS